jgi:hypothetical protein
MNTKPKDKAFKCHLFLMPCYHIDEKKDKLVAANTQRLLWLEGKTIMLHIDHNKGHS